MSRNVTALIIRVMVACGLALSLLLFLGKPGEETEVTAEGNVHMSGAAAMITPNPAGCQPGEIYFSSQDWWSNAGGNDRKPNGDLADDFGHLHTELCFPHNATITGEVTFHVRHIMHMNPGEMYKFNVQIYNSDEQDGRSRSCNSRHNYYCARFNPPRSIANCTRTGGTLSEDGDTCVWTDEVHIDTADFPYDGWQQFRFRAFVTQPNGDDMRTSTGLNAYLENGHVIKSRHNDHDVIEGRGWYDLDVNYTNASINDPPIAPVSGTWRPFVKMRTGHEGIDVTSHFAALNPNFHHGNPGIVLEEGEGEFFGRLRIDTTRLANGWHRLFLRADALHKPSGSTNSGIAAILFEVNNSPPCSENCVPPITAAATAPPPDFNINGPIHINFQKEGSPLADGYLPDYGHTFAPRNGLQYGWNFDVSHETKQRNRHPDPRLDSVAHILEGAAWEIALPNDLYRVTVGIGDSKDGDKPHTINVEGINYWRQHVLAAGEFEEMSSVVDLTDGRLTVDANGQNNSETHIDFLIIEPLIYSDIRVNFQPRGTRLIDGYLPDYGELFSSKYGYEYGWNFDVSDEMRIRHIQSDPRLDTVAHIKQNSHWEIAIPNGRYQVTVSIGDATDASGHTVNVENIPYWNNLNLNAGDFLLKTQVVSVTDGRLTLDSLGQSDDETHIDYIEITPSHLIRTVVPKATLFVSPAGSDEAGDGSIDNPFQTLQRAVDAAEPGTTIYARAGTYDVGNLFTAPRPEDDPIDIRPFPGEIVIFTGLELPTEE